LVCGLIVSPVSYGTVLTVNRNGQDQTSAIQNAINSVSNGGGGTVVLPDALYLVSSALNLPAHVRLRGEGRSTTVLRSTNNGTAVINITGSAAAVEAMTVEHSNSGVSGDGITIYGSLFDINIRDCLIRSNNNGLTISGGSAEAFFYRIENCRFDGNKGFGMWTEGLKDSWMNQNMFVGNGSNDGTYWNGGGLSLKAAEGIYTNKNQCFANLGFGYLIATGTVGGNSKDPVNCYYDSEIIDSNYGPNVFMENGLNQHFATSWIGFGGFNFGGSALPGVWALTSEEITFKSCTIIGNKSDGIVMDDCTDIQLLNNICSGNGNQEPGPVAAIHFRGNWRNVTISGNRCFDRGYPQPPFYPQDYGIWITGGINHLIMSNNDCTGNVVKGIYDQKNASVTSFVITDNLSSP
jgi:parallel beta-helix repeat protein